MNGVFPHRSTQKSSDCVIEMPILTPKPRILSHLIPRQMFLKSAGQIFILTGRVPLVDYGHPGITVRFPVQFHDGLQTDNHR